MLKPVNVYWHDDGHYMLAPGPALDAIRDARIAWLGTMELEALNPLLREAIEDQLQRRSCAWVTAAQFYAPTRHPRAPPH